MNTYALVFIIQLLSNLNVQVCIQLSPGTLCKTVNLFLQESQKSQNSVRIVIIVTIYPSPVVLSTLGKVHRLWYIGLAMPSE